MSNVSRSVFTKKAEECKRLKNDLYNIVMENDDAVYMKWKKHFEQEEQFSQMLRDFAKKNNRNIRKA